MLLLLYRNNKENLIVKSPGLSTYSVHLELCLHMKT